MDLSHPLLLALYMACKHAWVGNKRDYRLSKCKLCHDDVDLNVHKWTHQEALCEHKSLLWSLDPTRRTEAAQRYV